MPIDYSTRQIPGNVSRNRPKKKSIGGVVILFITALSVSYLMGIATGWFLHGQQPKPVSIAKPASSPPVPSTAPPPAVPPDASAGSQVVQHPSPALPLTFYDSLAKGEKAVMGSGINPAPPGKELKSQKPAPSPQLSPSTPQGQVRSDPLQLPDQPRQKDEPSTSRIESDSHTKQKDEPPKPVVPTRQPAKGYAVQIVSTADRGEAESLKSRFQAKGISAYVVAFEHKGKSWYRVRAGRSMTEQAAKALAASIGEGAIVVTE